AGLSGSRRSNSTKRGGEFFMVDNDRLNAEELRQRVLEWGEQARRWTPAARGGNGRRLRARWEDIVQDTICAALEGPPCKSRASFDGWIETLLHTQKRKAGREYAREIPTGLVAPDSTLWWFTEEQGRGGVEPSALDHHIEHE